MRFCLKEIANCLHVDADAGLDPIINGVSIDSRKITPGDMFVCLPGNRTDGHAFAANAVAAGCSAILASRPLPNINVPVIVTPDTEQSLADLASFARARTSAKVVCITGTAGKTTLKDTLAAIMRRKGRVEATEGNHNNQVGLPLTILNARGDEDFWILEAGISHAGDMDLLGSIARPDLAIILNVGPGHTEGLGEKGVAWHKSRLLKYLSKSGIALVSADYPELKKACSEADVEPVYFSIYPNGKCRFYLEEAGSGWQRINLAGESARFKTPFTISFGNENAVAAAAAAFLLGAVPDEISEGFKNVKLPEQRFREIGLPDKIHIFDDTYNANPLSMSRALDGAAFRAEKLGLPFYVVLGAMGELGAAAGRWHRELGRQLARLGPKAVFWKGPYGDEVQDGLCAAGSRLKLIYAEAPGEFVEAWRSHNLPMNGMIVLFKGSRVNKLENHMHAFCAMFEAIAEQGNVL